MLLILKLNLKTPGREEDDEETKLYTKADYKARENGAQDAGADAAELSPEDQKSALITRGLGGKKNISDVDCCATRLRCTVRKPELVFDLDDLCISSIPADIGQTPSSEKQPLLWRIRASWLNCYI